MAKALYAGIAIIATTSVLLPANAFARDWQGQKRPVAAARFGLISSKAPRMGPKLVRRGGNTPISDMVRPRFDRGMIDAYPLDNAGFHFSFGGRYFARSNFWGAAEQTTRGVLFNPRWRNNSGFSPGFRRRTWAMTAGYDTEILPQLVVGIEGGMIRGRAITRVPRGRLFRDGGKNTATAINPVASLAVRWAF